MKETTVLATADVDRSRLVLQQHDGEHYLLIDGVTLMSTIACHSEQEMATLACADRESIQRVLIGGLGFGFTLRRVLELVGKGASVTVAELLDVIIEWNDSHLQELNGKLLSDPRVTVEKADVMDLIKQASAAPYDVILLDVDNSPDALVQHGNAHLYSRKGLELVKAALGRKGRVVFWSANEDKAFAKLLGKIFRKVESVPCKPYPKAKRFSHTLFLAEK